MRKTLIALASASVLTITGCTAASSVPEPSPSAVAYATENQVASVIAGYEPDWREVIEDSANCRFLWVLGGSTFAEEVEAMTCFIQEKTMGVTAQIVIRDLGKLEIPPSMAELVGDTNVQLQAIADIDLELLCGSEDVPSDAAECTEALGSRNFVYGVLDGTLDKWSPYL